MIPHEGAAMAHGYSLATGRSQALMAHTHVGLANSAIEAISTSVEHGPVLLLLGGTPTTERGRFGGRSGWGQEMRDQTAPVRKTNE